MGPRLGRGRRCPLTSHMTVHAKLSFSLSWSVSVTNLTVLERGEREKSQEENERERVGREGRRYAEIYKDGHEWAWWSGASSHENRKRFQIKHFMFKWSVTKREGGREKTRRKQQGESMRALREREREGGEAYDPQLMRHMTTPQSWLAPSLQTMSKFHSSLPTVKTAHRGPT